MSVINYFDVITSFFPFPKLSIVKYFDNKINTHIHTFKNNEKMAKLKSCLTISTTISILYKVNRSSKVSDKRTKLKYYKLRNLGVKLDLPVALFPIPYQVDEIIVVPKNEYETVNKK